MIRPSKPAGREAASRPFERRVLREGIRDQLMKDILSGRLAPGDRIVETRVAQQFGVSQAPVREALRDLELCGFVVSSAFRGSMVRQYSIEDLVQLYPVRAVIEGLAARDAARMMTASALRRLDASIVTMRSAVLRRDLRAAIDADIAFHQTVVEASGNPVIHEFWERTRLGISIYLTVLSKPFDQLQELGERHLPILEALRHGDSAEAERTMREHIEDPLRILAVEGATLPIVPRKTRTKHDGSRRRPNGEALSDAPDH